MCPVLNILFLRLQIEHLTLTQNPFFFSSENSCPSVSCLTIVGMRRKKKLSYEISTEFEDESIVNWFFKFLIFHYKSDYKKDNFNSSFLNKKIFINQKKATCLKELSPSPYDIYSHRVFLFNKSITSMLVDLTSYLKGNSVEASKYSRKIPCYDKAIQHVDA